MSDGQNKSIHAIYRGERTPLLKLAVVTSLLTLITLGIYRFWAKTRIRKYIWSSASAGGDGFEYTGTGLEKFLGFLVAIVILAIYLAVVQMILFFFGVSLIGEPQTQEEMLIQVLAIYATLFAIAPLIYFAQYRARRYKLARTRWRGIRFGAEKGAWGYVLQAILYTILSAMTLGLLMPLRRFMLEKYVTDRTWYGDAQFRQNGEWTHMYRPMKHLIIGVVILIAGSALGIALEAPILAALGMIVGMIWASIGYVYFQVHSFIYLTAHKVLGEDITFSAAPRTGEIVIHIIVGGLIVSLILGGMSIVLGLVMSGVMAIAGSGSEIMAIGVVGLTYLLALLFAGALSLVWVVQPIIEHVVSTISVANPERLDDIRQRESDTGADAEGFADALDVGGAI